MTLALEPSSTAGLLAGYDRPGPRYTSYPTAVEFHLTTLGRLFVRNVCMVFDRHLRHRSAESKPVFSRTV